MRAIQYLVGAVGLISLWSGCSSDSHFGAGTDSGVVADLRAHTPDMAATPWDMMRPYHPSPPAFEPPRAYSVDDPWAMAVGDFNGDQKLDLVVANLISKGVSVVLGDGLGGFSATSSFRVPKGALSVAVGDFNVDNKLDVAVSGGLGTISLLLGDGRGVLGPATEFAVGRGNWTVAVGDFNLDLKPDLAVAIDNIAVDVLLGDGRGSFSPAKTFPVGDYPISSGWLTVADFNLDGKPDLAVSNRNIGIGDATSILLGDGKGSFAKASDVNMPAGMGLVAGDFNLDGKPDLAGAITSRLVSIVLGDGRGGFGPVGGFLASAGTGYGLAVGDFNEDKRPDIAVSSLHVRQGMNLALGDGLGDFITFTPTTGDRIVCDHAVVGDFNGDLKPDVAVEDHDTNEVIVLLGLGGASPP